MDLNRYWGLKKRFNVPFSLSHQHKIILMTLRIFSDLKKKSSYTFENFLCRALGAAFNDYLSTQVVQEWKLYQPLPKKKNKHISPIVVPATFNIINNNKINNKVDISSYKSGREFFTYFHNIRFLIRLD